MNQQSALTRTSSVGGIFDFIKPAIGIVATAGQVATLLQDAGLGMSPEETELRHRLGMPPSADLGPVSLIQDTSGIHAINMMQSTDVDVVFADPRDRDTTLSTKLAPGDRFNLSPYMYGMSVPGTTEVQFRALEDGLSASANGQRNWVISADIRDVQIGQNRVAGRLQFRITPTQIILLTAAAAALYVATRMQFSVSGGSGQQFAFSLVMGEKSNGGGVEGDAGDTWVFELPENLSDFGIDESTRFDLDIDLQYQTQAAWTPEYSEMSQSPHPASADLRAGLAALRDLRQRQLSQNLA